MTDTNAQGEAAPEPLQITWEVCCFLADGLPDTISLSCEIEPEDPEELSTSGCLYAIADGWGIAGVEAGRDAIHRLVSEYYFQVKFQPGERLKRIFLGLGEYFYTQASKNDNRQPTVDLIAAVMIQNQITFASAGGNRAYLIHDGQVQLITHDPSGLNEMLRKGIILVEEAEEASQQRKLFHPLGESQSAELDIIENIPVFAGDCILLCNDAVSQRIETEELTMRVAQTDIQAICDALIEPEHARGLLQNQILTVLKFQEYHQPAAELEPELILPNPMLPILDPGEEDRPAPEYQEKTIRRRLFSSSLGKWLFLCLIVGLLVFFIANWQTNKHKIFSPMISAQERTLAPVASPTGNQAASIPSLTLHPASGVTFVSPTPVMPSPVPTTASTMTPEIAAGRYACVWDVEQGNSLFSTIRRFNIPYAISESYYYFADCDLEKRTCNGAKEIIESHSSIDTGWFILIPVTDETACKEGKGTWVRVSTTVP